MRGFQKNQSLVSIYNEIMIFISFQYLYLLCFFPLRIVNFTNQMKIDYCMRHVRHMELIVYQMLNDGKFISKEQYSYILNIGNPFV